MRARWLPLGLWLLGLAGCLAIVARTQYSADMSAFLPRSPSRSQQLLVQQLRDGLASRLLLIGIEGADLDARARLARCVSGALRADPAFADVEDGESAAAARDRAFVFAHRYQLSPEVVPGRFAGAGMRAAILDDLDLMQTPAGALAAELFRRDPTGETLALMDRMAVAAPRRERGVWASRDGTRALLLAETRAGGSDTDGQAVAIGRIRADFRDCAADSAPGAAPPPAAPRLLLSGPGAFAVQARAAIEQAALRLSLWSSALIVALLLCVYRSPSALLLGLLPVLSGALAGIAAVSLGFGVVHGVTLGFGITLIGEAVDYSVYLFIQTCGAPGGGRAVSGHALWPTIGLGMLTSVCGFASLLPSAFPGLAQIGAYSIAGLITAAAVTRYVLPRLLPARLPLADLAPYGRRLARWLQRAPARATRLLLGLLALAALVLLATHQGPFWNRDLAALSPVPIAAQALDAQLRSDLGAPDVGNLVIAGGPDEQSTLRAADAAAARLDTLIGAGVIAGYDSPTRYLPSLETQAARRAALPDAASLRARLRVATAALPIGRDALDGFVSDVQRARAAPDLTRADLQGTSFALAVDALLWRSGTRWFALLPLRAPNAGLAAGNIDIVRVRAALAPLAADGVTVLNIRQETTALYESYLRAAARLSVGGLGAIVLLLLLALRSPGRAARVLAPLLLAVLLVTAALIASGTALTLLHLIGLLLIIAVGSNYALFFDRRAAGHDREALPLTLASLVVANACTVLGFGTLALSSVPVLHDLGVTVAPGTLLALLLSALLAPRELFATATTRRMPSPSPPESPA